MNYGMNIANNLYSWLTTNNQINTIKQLSDNQILTIANDINSLLSETNLIDHEVNEIGLPRLVVVGTQSSGKSSVLNGIISMDILPMGGNMVTRTPLDIRLHQINSGNEGWIEFGQYVTGIWEVEKKITFRIPVPTETDLKDIRDTITKMTERIAGIGMDISQTPIILNIFSPNVPNLSLVDLPGLTMVACTDKGQPDNIKEKIEDLATSYINNPKTITLLVMESRLDLETNLGLALIKKNNTQTKIIGVLTKPDLMNNETHIGDYLTNNISKNLMVTYGYFVVKNRSNKEMKEFNIIKGYDKEREYFAQHNEYKKPIYKSKCGTPNLTGTLSKILILSISEELPYVMTEIIGMEIKVHEKLDKLGQTIPLTKEGKLSLLNKYISNFYQNFVDSIESRGNSVNTGKQIKDIFTNYKKEMAQINPFKNTSVYSQEYFDNIISSFEGNHMSFHVPPVQILEACMNDRKHRPILALQTLSMTCVDNICELLINLIREITNYDEFNHYPQLASFIMSYIIDQILGKVKNRAKEQINLQLRLEGDYIWTDNVKFHKSLAKITQEPVLNRDSIIIFLSDYYECVKEIICHIVPKIIMSIIIRDIEGSMSAQLSQNLATEDKMSLLKEDDEVEEQRKELNAVRNRILEIKRVFNKNQ